MTYRYPGGLVRRTAANTSITGASGVWDLGSQAQAVKTNTWPISGLANPVSGSLRFRGGSVNAFLSRTPASSSNRRTWTWSGWIKLGSKSDGYFPLFGADANGYPCSGISLTNFNIQYFSYTHPVYDWQKISTAVFRDPSAWYHIVAVSDTTNGTAEDRAIVYVNGQRITSWSTNNNPSSSFEGYVNSSSYITKVGRIAGFDYFDGCMAEVNFVDGQALTPSSFGQTSPITGVWEPIKYTGTYGTNGFYLSLSDTSSIGKDFSGNGNNWTPNNISTASGSTFDLMRDVPTQWAPQGVTDVGGTVRGNYATLNRLDFTTVGTISEGNLKFTQGTSGAKSGRATFGVSSGKWYWEYTHLGGNSSPGIGNASMTLDYYCGGDANGWSYFVGGSKYNNDASTLYGASYTTNDVIGVALDMDAGTLVFYKNGASQGTAFSSLTGTMFPAFSSSSVSNVTFTVNFGQQPFAYTPPSGFKSLCTTNLPTPTIGATVATAANKNFDATLYTGNDTGQSVINAGAFQPSLIWYKARSAAYYNTLIDDIRGAGTRLFSNLTDGESNDGIMTSFNTNGFTLGANSGEGINKNAVTYVAWQWKGATSNTTNTSGTITSNVRANPTAGFSIVTYTGTGSGGTRVGHGLGVAPKMMIVKQRGSTTNWAVYHQSLPSAFNVAGTQVLNLNTTATNTQNFDVWDSNDTEFNRFSVGASTLSNASGGTYVAYCFAEIAGYSAFGKYTGNGSTDGPFIYTGFRPKFVMWKNSSAAEAWLIEDTARSTYNQVALELYPSSSGAEAAGSSRSPTQQFDFLSNGFKVRGAQEQTNGSGNTIIYAAFAETPFKNALAR